MNSLIIALICIAPLYSSAQSYINTCDSGNPCDMTGVFVPANGYGCSQTGTTYQCFCPGNDAELNKPCRLCDRTNSLQDVCSKTSGKLVKCLEGPVYDNYACFCTDGKMTSNANCDTTVTATTRPPTTTTTGSSGGTNPCANGGVLYNGGCNCPSGYIGAYCTGEDPPTLCKNINCMNNGTCAIRATNGKYEGVCLCRYGTSGDYCELTGTLGYCSPNLCLNGGACRENVIGATRFAYCYCPAGYNGAKCETPYFTCQYAGKIDDYVMHRQGKYFECTYGNGVLRAEQKSCPRGLLFNSSPQSCTL